VVEGPALLGERAALMGLRRHGQVSPGGGTRLLRAADGWWALNLARDADLVPALTSRARHGDVWDDVQAWASGMPVQEILDRTMLLGLAASGLGETTVPFSPWRLTRRDAHAAGRERPRVVNLGALWAGPLAANLLALTGAEIIDVQSRHRPDPVRVDSPDFYAVLHNGHERRSLDFDLPGEVRRVVADADIVIEASRPRALRSLQADAESVLADGRARTWLRITGHRDTARVAFGDDAAVAGGLVAWSDDEPAFAGDAIADPLTGLLGALAVIGTRSAHHTTLIDIAMADVAAYSAAHTFGDPTPAAVVADPHVGLRIQSSAVPPARQSLQYERAAARIDDG
jgi:hypothetical protein